MSRRLFQLGLFFILSFSVSLFSSAQEDTCLGQPADNKISFANPVQGRVTVESDIDDYYFDAEGRTLWRLDGRSAASVTYTLYGPEQGLFLTAQDASQGWIRTSGTDIFSGIFYLETTGRYCIRVETTLSTEATYSLRLTPVEEIGDQLTGLNDLNSGGFSYDEIGHYYYNQQRYDDAAAAYLRAVELDATNPVFQNNVCAAYYWMGDYSLTIEYCSEAIRLNPDYINAHDWRSVAYRARDMYAEALADYDRLVELAPQSDVFLFNRGVTYILMGDVKEAIADLEISREMTQGSPYWLGVAQLQAGDLDAAQRSLEDALVTDRSANRLSTFTLIWLHVMARIRGETGAANGYLEEARASAGREDGASKFQAQAFIALLEGDIDASREFFREALIISPLAHQHIFEMAYLTVLAEAFPFDEDYPEMLEWLKSKVVVG